VETGIDNCVSISASVQGRSLSWSITGSEATIDHYVVFISSDGQNLMPLAQVGAGNHTLNLDSFDFGTGPYTLHVKAVGKPSLLNHMSNGVRFPQGLSIAVAPASLTLTPGASGNLTVKLTPQNGSFDQPVALSCSGLPSHGSCAFSPATVTPGAQEVSTTLTIAVGSSVAGRKPFGNSGGGSLYAIWLATAGVIGAVLTTPAAGQRRRRYYAAAVVLALMVLQVACGITASTEVPPPTVPTSTTYSVVITGTSSGQQFSTAATLTVR
jgi:hypothetical protein